MAFVNATTPSGFSDNIVLGSTAEAQFRDRRRGQVGLCLALALRNFDQYDSSAVARNDGVGNGATGHPLHGLVGNVSKRNADHRVAADHFFEQLRVVDRAQHRQQSRSHQRLGDRARGQGTADLFHQHGRIQHAEPQAAGCFRHT